MFGSITGQNNQENVLFLYAPILNKESVLKNIEKRYHFHCPYTRKLGLFFFPGGGEGGEGGRGGGDFWILNSFVSNALFLYPDVFRG